MLVPVFTGNQEASTMTTISQEANTMKTISKSLARAAVAAALSTAVLAPATAVGEVVYQNDFDTRTSAGGVPFGDWREVPYSVGKLVNDSYSNVFGASDLQDNWIRGANNGAAPARIIDDDGNQCAALCGNGDLHVIVKHRIGNTFTTGTVVAQADFRAPNPYTGWGNAYGTRFMVGDETFFSPETPASSYMSAAAASVGIVVDGGAFKFWRKDGTKTAGGVAGHWYRAVVTLNIDARTWGVDWYDLGADTHPTLDTATPGSPVFSTGSIAFDANVLDEVSSIGLACYSPGGGADGANPVQSACFDNIRIWHDGVECYVNDFATRRSRILPDGQTSFSYSATTPATNVVSYATGVNLLAAQNSSLQVQPVGVDGWRRLNKDQTGTLKTVAYQSDVVGQTTDNTGSFDWAGHALGQTFTGGKVRIAADTRTTSLTDTGWAYVALGSDVMYAGNYSTFSSGCIARAGISGEKAVVDGVTKRKVGYWTSSGYVLPGDALLMTDWIRLVIEVDLDAKTYDFSVFRQNDGASHPAFGSADGTLLYSKTGIGTLNSVSSISSFAIVSYWSVTYFDNVCVWHTPADGARTLVYSNTFSNRTVCGYGGVEDALVGTMDKAPVGLDGWTRLGTAAGDIVLVGGADQAIGFGAVGSASPVFAAHDLGGLFASGRTKTQFDICAPSAWDGSNGGAFVWLGGDRYHEGDLNGGYGTFYKWSACGAGISGGAFAAYGGDGAGGGGWLTAGTATAGHWYRFVMKSALENGGLSDVSVFDMGTTRPTLASDAPTTGAVATFKALPFRRSFQSLGGVSCVGIQAEGVKVASPLVATEARVLIDNIAFSWSSSVFVLVVR